jgi:hypothetical protein
VDGLGPTTDEAWDVYEGLQDIRRVFDHLLAPVLADGQQKRRRGKVHWREDSDHEAAMMRHIAAWKAGARRDPDSGANPLAHAAARAFMLAAQEEGL